MEKEPNATKEIISRTLVGVAGVHYVVSELSRRGMIALPTTRNTAGYDVIVVSTNGRKHANIQVKTASNPKARFWPVASAPEKIRTGRDDYYVFLRGLRKGGEVDAYMLEGRRVLQEVKRQYKDLVSRGDKKPFPYCLYHRRGVCNDWAAKWKRWTL